MGLVLDNPVLDAYIRGSNEKRQQVQQQFENQLQTEAGKRAQTQLDAYTKHLDAEHSHQSAQLDLERSRLDLEKQSHELQARQLIGQMLSQGIMKPPTQEQASSSPVGGIQVGSQVIDPRQFASPQDLLNQETQRARAMGGVQAETAGQTATAQASALQPFQRLQAISAHQMDLEKQLEAHKQEMEKVKEQGANALATTNAHVEGQKVVAGIQGRYKLDAARIAQFGGVDNPNDWAGMVLPYATGDAQKPLGNTSRDLIIRQHLNATGMKEFTAKQKTDLDKLHTMDPVFNLMNEFVQQAPRTNSGAAGDLVFSKIPTTQLNDFKARVRSMGGSLAAGLDAQTGRMANQEIERILGGLATPGKTVDQAKKDIDLLRSRYSSKALDATMGGIPDKQKLLILRNNNFDPGQFTTNFQGREIPRYKKDPSDGEWLVFDPSKKGYTSLDATRQ